MCRQQLSATAFRGLASFASQLVVMASAAATPKPEHASATEEPTPNSPRSDQASEMDPRVASVLRMGAQTLDEALGFASTRDLLDLYGSVSDAVMMLAQDARPVPPPAEGGPARDEDDAMPFASGAEASGYRTPPSGMDWPYPDMFILHPDELPSWIPRQGVPEALKHLQVRGYCTYPCPRHGTRCIGLCLRPVLLGEDRAHTGHACFY